MIIYLLGLPSSGKTTLGRALALSLKLGFIDMDHEIELASGKSIPEIFELEGENQFRVYEQKVLLEISQKKNNIISTGGGAPCFFDNIQVMNSTGLTVFIDVNPSEIVKRLNKSKGTNDRPLLKDIDSEQLENELKDKLKSRRSFYQKAKIHIKDDHLVVAKLKEAIQETLNY